MANDSKPLSVTVGGTAVAVFVAFIVMLVISTLVAFLMSVLQYYVGNMRWEAAIFIGNVAGGIASIYAARASCDAVIKQYSLRAVFVVLAALTSLAIILQISKGFNQETVFRLATAIPMIGAAWLVFWKNEY